jgi:hypothetical protein
MFLFVRLAYRYGKTNITRDLIAEWLRNLPGYKSIREFATTSAAAFFGAL